MRIIAEILEKYGVEKFKKFVCFFLPQDSSEPLTCLFALHLIKQAFFKTKKFVYQIFWELLDQNMLEIPPNPYLPVTIWDQWDLEKEEKLNGIRSLTSRTFIKHLLYARNYFSIFSFTSPEPKEEKIEEERRFQPPN